MSGARLATADRRRHRRCLRYGIVIGLMLVFTPGSASAEWTGISLDIANTDTDWKFRNETREASNSEISFQIEERTAGGLTVGAAIGYFDMRLLGPTAAETAKFDGQYFAILLRQDFAMTPRWSLHGGIGFKYASGTESGIAVDGADIDWTETDAELGIGFRVANLRVMPFAAWSEVDGDVSDSGGTAVFSMNQPDIQGIRFDLFTEQTAFVRLEFVSGGRTGGTLVFARRY